MIISRSRYDIGYILGARSRAGVVTAAWSPSYWYFGSGVLGREARYLSDSAISAGIGGGVGK